MLSLVAAAGARVRGQEGEPSATRVFTEAFEGTLAEGWRWLGESAGSWELREGRLAIRTPVAGIFRDDRRGENLLLRTLPAGTEEWCVEVDLFARPAGLYENAGLILYADGDHYAVVTEESFPGHRDPPEALRVFSEIDQRLEGDRLVSYQRAWPVRLRMRIGAATVTGSYRDSRAGSWTEIGSSPRPPGESLFVGLQTGYGEAGSERWAVFDDFSIAAGCAGVPD